MTQTPHTSGPKPPFRPRLALLAAAILGVGALAGFSYAATQVFEAHAASLYLSPVKGNYPMGGNLSVEILADTGGQPVNAVQANLEYPTDRLQFVSVDATGSAFDINAASSGGNGTVSVARGKVGEVTGKVLVATVKFAITGSAGPVEMRVAKSSALVASSSNMNLLRTTAGGTYQVTPGAAPQPAAAGETDPADLPASPWVLATIAAASTAGLILAIVLVVNGRRRRPPTVPPGESRHD